jgi:hypothetical protein
MLVHTNQGNRMPDEQNTAPTATETPESAAQAQPQPQTSPATPLVTNQAGAFAISALVVGIVATFSSWIPVWGVLVGSTALVLGIIALKKNQNKGLAITGIVTGGLATLLSLFITALLIVAFANGFSESQNGYGVYDDGYYQQDNEFERRDNTLNQ